MSKRNSTFASFLACVALLAFSGGHWPKAMSESPGPHTQSSGTFVPNPNETTNTPDPKQLLLKAIERLAPERVSWLETQVWQRMLDHAGMFEGTGRLLRGPFQTVNLRMQVRRDDNVSTVRCVSDGRQFVKIVAVAGAHPNVMRLAMPAAATTQDLHTLIQHREAFLQANGCSGPIGLLRTIAIGLQDAKAESGSWNGRPTIRIQGCWNPIRKAPVGPSDFSNKLPYTPRMCRVILDADSLWPHRIEWWHNDAVNGDVLVLQIEFRDPVVNQPVTQHRWDAEFAVPQAADAQRAAR